MSDVRIRRAGEHDLPALLDIYNYYVLNTHITFDVEPRTLAQRREWFSHFGLAGRYQCFVAVRDDLPIGWASSHPFKDRAAYDTSVETSVYLTEREKGRGIGRSLYAALLTALGREDVHRAFGGIAQPNEASVRLHLASGFTQAGLFEEVGRKFGKYWNVSWYQRVMR
jgi:phosphinothricin acetyltransferase